MRAVFTSIAVAIATFFATSASAEVYSCHIGKPSYCFNYGGNLCEQWNNAPGKPAACAKWTAACLDCLNAIPTCLGNKRPLSTAPQCTSCNTKWLACMKRIDHRFWPNRQTRG